MLGGDIKIKWDSVSGYGDISIDDEGVDLSTDEGLQTAVIMSLFTDRRADDEELPSGTTSKRGWWGDSLADVEGDMIGSKLWLIYREKELNSVAVRAEQYALEALQWLLDTKIASQVDVTAELLGSGRLGLGVKIHRPKKLVEYRFNYNWDAQGVTENAI